MQLTKDINNILESAVSNSSKQSNFLAFKK